MSFFGRSRMRAILWAAGVAALVSCGDDFTHQNPFDPATSVLVVLDGPDSLVARGDTILLTVRTTPAYEHGPVIWLPGPGQVTPLGAPGAYRWDGTGTESLAFSAIVDGRKATRLVAARQRPAALHFGCGKVYEFDAVSAYGDARAADTLCDVVRDRHGYAIAGVAMQYASRNPAVADVWPNYYGAQAVHALASGTTWVIGRYGPFADSAQVHVAQKFARLTVSPCVDYLYTTLHAGDTLRMQVGLPALDRLGSPMPVSDSTLAVLRAGTRFWSNPYISAYRVDSTGLVTVSQAYSGGTVPVTVSWPNLSVMAFGGAVTCNFQLM